MAAGTSAVVEEGRAAAASDAVATWAPGPAADSRAAELAQLQHHQPHIAHKQQQQRLYFIDWLRTVLTVFVVVNHVWNSCRPKGGDFYWFVQKTNQDDLVVATVVDWLVSTPSMPYAMCLFFLLAGYFTPGSFNRKGPLKHVWDRLLRLLIPVVVYAVLINPLIFTVNKAAGIPAGNPSLLAVVRDMSYTQVWSWWFSNFNIAFGPTWFVWCLFWFDVGYVLVRIVHSTLQKPLEHLSARKSAAAGASESNTAGVHGGEQCKLQAGHVALGVGHDTHAATRTEAGKQCELQVGHVALGVGNDTHAATRGTEVPTADEYSVKTVLAGMAVLTFAFTVTSFAALMATYTSTKAAGFDEFWIPCPFVLFRPSWMGPNAISFILGCQARELNLLRKLPARMTYWCLTAAALWWPFGYMMPTYIDTPYRPEPLWGNYPISGGMVGYIFYMKFASWSFALVWGLGMLLLFREHFNDAPGKFGRQLISGAYGAYIIHPLFIPLWGWAFKGVQFRTLAGNAILMSPFVVASSWAFTALVRCIPGTKRVLA